MAWRQRAKGEAVEAKLATEAGVADVPVDDSEARRAALRGKYAGLLEIVGATEEWAGPAGILGKALSRAIIEITDASDDDTEWLGAETPEFDAAMDQVAAELLAGPGTNPISLLEMESFRAGMDFGFLLREVLDAGWTPPNVTN